MLARARAHGDYFCYASGRPSVASHTGRARRQTMRRTDGRTDGWRKYEYASDSQTVSQSVGETRALLLGPTRARWTAALQHCSAHSSDQMRAGCGCSSQQVASISGCVVDVVVVGAHTHNNKL